MRSDFARFKLLRSPELDLPHDSVGALADDILNVVLLADIEGDLAGSGPLLDVTHSF